MGRRDRARPDHVDALTGFCSARRRNAGCHPRQCRRPFDSRRERGSMNWQLIVAGARTAVFGMLFLAGTASAELRIMNDQGGEVSSYLRTFYEMRASGERIIIDGPCLSACTLLTGIVPRDHVCVTNRQRRIALAYADARRHSTSDAALSSGNPRLDQPTWRAHAAAHDNARPGSGGVLAALRLKQESVIFIFVVFVLLLLAATCLRGSTTCMRHRLERWGSGTRHPWSVSAIERCSVAAHASRTGWSRAAGITS